jgi:hypothetical protein
LAVLLLKHRGVEVVGEAAMLAEVEAALISSCSRVR